MMGTRAQFFIGDPRDLAARKWLGCVAFDGQPRGDIGAELTGVTTEAGFAEAVEVIKSSRDDFCDPAEHGFPFPWTNDLFLTDFTYAWFDNAVQVACFHQGFLLLAKVMRVWPDGPGTLPHNVPAPDDYDRTAPDSIMLFSK